MDIDTFKKTPADRIKGSGYVVETLETVVWALLNTNDFANALLTCVNIGDDTDTTAAIAGGLAGLYYGLKNIPVEWINVIKRKDYIEKLISETADKIG